MGCDAYSGAPRNMGYHHQPMVMGGGSALRSTLVLQSVKTQANMPKVVGYALIGQIIGSLVAMIIWLDPFMLTWGIASIFRAMSLLGK
jgi:hypothetical protein